MQLPNYFSSRITFVAFGFSRKCQKDFDSWLTPFKTRYDKNKDVFFIEIPMIGKKSKMSEFIIRNAMKAGINRSLHNNVMVFFNDRAVYKEYYGFDQEDVGYFFLVDNHGEIVWQASSEATATKLDKLYFTIDKLLQGEV